MLNYFVAWGRFVANLVNIWVQNACFYTKGVICDTGRYVNFIGFTRSLLSFYQTLSPNFFRISYQLPASFYPSSTYLNNNKSFYKFNYLLLIKPVGRS